MIASLASIIVSLALTALSTWLCFGLPSEARVSVYAIWGCAMVLAIAIPGVMSPFVTWRLMALAEQVHKAQDALVRLAATDELTGLLNRRGFREPARRAISEAIQARRPVCALVCDIDKFKSINDSQGHDAGDIVIRRASEILTSRLADNKALLCRHGGDEFIAVLPHVSKLEAARIADEIRESCAAQTPGEGDLPAPFTISIGLADCSDGEATLESLLRRADDALYRAKQLGRNRVAA